MKKIMWALPVFALSLSPMAYAASAISQLSTDQIENFAENNSCFPSDTSRETFINNKLQEAKDGMGTDNVAGAMSDGSWSDFTTNFTSAIEQMPTCSASVMQTFNNEVSQSATLTQTVASDKAAVASATDPTTASAAEAKLQADSAQLSSVQSSINAQLASSPETVDDDDGTGN